MERNNESLALISDKDIQELNDIRTKLEQTLMTKLRNAGIYFHSMSRVKTLTSLQRKLDTGKYGTGKDDKKIQDLIEQIFEVVIADGKGIELNTSSRAYKLKSLMPSKEILKLYHDMGGKIITIGSDAHNADRIGDCVMESQKILKDIGFDGIYTFEKMKPEFHRF